MYRIEKGDIVPASRILAEAFWLDPMWRAFVPDDETRRDLLPHILEILVRFGYRYGSVRGSSRELEGIAVWFRGEASDLKLFHLLFGGFFCKSMKLMFKYGREMQEMQKSIQIIDEHRKQYMKGRDYLYLQIIAVAPEYQGQGHCGSLMRQLLDESRNLRIPIYLETGSEENTKIYRHYGFSVLGERDFPEQGFHLWQMLREPDEPSSL